MQTYGLSLLREPRSPFTSQPSPFPMRSSKPPKPRSPIARTRGLRRGCWVAAGRSIEVGKRNTADGILAETRTYDRTKVFDERLTGSVEVSSRAVGPLRLELRLHQVGEADLISFTVS